MPFGVYKKPKDAVHDRGATNHLRADCSGSTLALYANGRKLLDTPEDPNYTGRKLVGIFTDDAQNGEALDISFDNFVVTGPNAEGLP